MLYRQRRQVCIGDQVVALAQASEQARENGAVRRTYWSRHAPAPDADAHFDGNYQQDAACRRLPETRRRVLQFVQAGAALNKAIEQNAIDEF
ncbi:MAG TPA: hypothetical protein VKV17_23835 [Bryobacteraceae bacterium]|nr:hypothetical protein [Bryobacteraceae bacterium]